MLAAGGSTRCPGGKLLRLYKSRPLLSWLLERLQTENRISDVYLVCGYESLRVQEVGADYQKVRIVHNLDWESGIASSLIAGLRSLPSEAPGALICLGDTPCFKPQTLERIIPEAENLERIVLPVYEGCHGHPKYFPRWLFQELYKLSGDEGARRVLARHKENARIVKLHDPGILRDFDTPEDFL